jgi:LemA protein
MRNRKLTFYIVGGILLIVILYVIITFNSLVKKEEKFRQHLSEIGNTYQRRIDLIPNLVNVVKGAADFENKTLVELVEKRSQALKTVSSEGTTGRERFDMQDSLAAATNRLLIAVERYPSLRGTEAFSALQVQLEGSERRIRYARNDFNESIADYNNKVRSFPSNLVALLFGFRAEEGFQAVEGSDKAVQIKF